MMGKEEILDKIIKYYVNSGDFNGLPLSQLSNSNYEILCDLIDENKITVITDKEFCNPHIRPFNFTTPNDVKKSYLESNCYSVLYPMPIALTKIRTLKDRPYTNLLRKGHPKFEIIYFNIEVLESYINNPKYCIWDCGYRGKIYPKDEFADEEDLYNDYIKDFGLAYKKQEEQTERAIGVFIDDLSKLDCHKQLFWRSFQIKNQQEYYMGDGFIRNLVFGEWVEYAWIYQAILDDMLVINRQCEAIGIPHLFRCTYSDPNDIEGFRHILLPTLKNYNDFIVVLEKLIDGNISYDIFTYDSKFVKSISRKDEKGIDKGSLSMLSEWLKLNIHTPEDLDKIIIKPLKDIREKRQIPAHDLSKNKYDKELYKAQANIVLNAYSAIRNIRLLFANHPMAKNIEVPEYLITGENIIDY